MSTPPTEVDDFHKHLDNCKQCREQPFNLCSIGHTLIHKAHDAITTEVPHIPNCRTPEIR